MDSARAALDRDSDVPRLRHRGHSGKGEAVVRGEVRREHLVPLEVVLRHFVQLAADLTGASAIVQVEAEELANLGCPLGAESYIGGERWPHRVVPLGDTSRVPLSTRAERATAAPGLVRQRPYAKAAMAKHLGSSSDSD